MHRRVPLCSYVHPPASTISKRLCSVSHVERLERPRIAERSSACIAVGNLIKKEYGYKSSRSNAQPDKQSYGRVIKGRKGEADDGQSKACEAHILPPIKTLDGKKGRNEVEEDDNVANRVYRVGFKGSNLAKRRSVGRLRNLGRAKAPTSMAEPKEAITDKKRENDLFVHIIFFFIAIIGKHKGECCQGPRGCYEGVLPDLAKRAGVWQQKVSEEACSGLCLFGTCSKGGGRV